MYREKETKKRKITKSECEHTRIEQIDIIELGRLYMTPMITTQKNNKNVDTSN